jgi:hypothetical protein
MGKQSTPSDWLGGTGEGSTVGEQERYGAGAAWSTWTTFEGNVKATV